MSRWSLVQPLGVAADRRLTALAEEISDAAAIEALAKGELADNEMSPELAEISRPKVTKIKRIFIG